MPSTRPPYPEDLRPDGRTGASKVSDSQETCARASVRVADRERLARPRRGREAETGFGLGRPTSLQAILRSFILLLAEQGHTKRSAWWKQR